MWIASNLNGTYLVRNIEIDGRGGGELNIWDSAKYILWSMAGKGSLDGFAALTSEKHERPNKEGVCLEYNSQSGNRQIRIQKYKYTNTQIHKYKDTHTNTNTIWNINRNTEWAPLSLRWIRPKVWIVSLVWEFESLRWRGERWEDNSSSLSFQKWT